MRKEKESKRELIVRLGFIDGKFDYNIYENTKSTSLFKKIANNIERKKQLNPNISLNEQLDDIDNMIDYTTLFKYNNLTENNNNLYKEGKFLWGTMSFCPIRNKMVTEIDGGNEHYIPVTMRQLQLILNQPYVNINTNQVFRLYEKFNIENSTEDELFFDVTTKDVPISIMHDCIKEHKKHPQHPSLTDYSYEDVQGVNAIAQTIKKISQFEVNDMLELINGKNIKKKVEYYKNNRNKFTREYQ